MTHSRLRPTARLAPLAALLAVAGVLSGCDGKQVPAIGPAFEIVVMAPEGKKVLATEVASVLGAEIDVLRMENRYLIDQDILEDFGLYTTRKLLFVIAEPEDEPLQKFLRRASGEQSPTTFPGLWIETEPFAAGQTAFLLTGEAQQMVRNVRERSEELIAIVEDATTKLILSTIMRPGEVQNARNDLRGRYGWGVRLPLEWTVEDRSSDTNRFVRIWRDAPVAQMFVSWEDGEVTRTPEEWLERRHELTWVHYDQDEVVWERSTGAAGQTPHGWDGTLLRGIWRNDKYVIGGPFESWTFYCPDDDRTYLVDLSVYAPDRDKLPLLRVLRSVARTFRCGCPRDLAAPLVAS